MSDHWLVLEEEKNASFLEHYWLQFATNSESGCDTHQDLWMLDDPSASIINSFTITVMTDNLIL